MLYVSIAVVYRATERRGENSSPGWTALRLFRPPVRAVGLRPEPGVPRGEYILDRSCIYTVQIVIQNRSKTSENSFTARSLQLGAQYARHSHNVTSTRMSPVTDSESAFRRQIMCGLRGMLNSNWSWFSIKGERDWKRRRTSFLIGEWVHWSMLGNVVL